VACGARRPWPWAGAGAGLRRDRRRPGVRLR